MRNKFVIAALLLLAVFAVWFFRRKPANTVGSAATNIKQSENIKPQGQEQKLTVAINGQMVSPETAEKRPIAVMVENHPDARPQSGLINADIVYEILAEGGITRFMPLYQTQAAANIGPIRSARTYFAEIADELGAVYAHVGGNSDALENIKSGVYKNISDADQFFDDGTYFHRITTRIAPHNVYSSISKLQALVTSKKFSDRESFQPWLFKNADTLYASSVPAVNITIDFSLSQFLVNYKYDLQNNQYLRFLAGKPHVDLETGKQLSAKDVIVQFVDIFPVKSDTPLSIGMTLTGQGKANVFLDGKVIVGTWKKTGNDRTRYYNEKGEEIKFNPGAIWVEIVPTDRSVTWK